MKFTRLIRIAALALLPLSVQAQTLEKAYQAVTGDLEKALSELATLREDIAEEKVPLSSDINGLEDEVIALENEVERLERLSRATENEQRSLENEVEQFREQNDYLKSILDEYVRNFEQRIGVSEIQLYEALTAEAKNALEKPDLSNSQKLEKQIAVVSAGIERLKELAGGKRFEGKALSSEGLQQEGSYALFGPEQYFASSDGSVAGVVQRARNVADPMVQPIPERLRAGLTGLAQTGEGLMPADPTNRALKIEGTKRSIAEHIALGGVVGYTIIGLGLVALLLGVFKAFEINRFRAPEPGDVNAVLDAIDAGDEKKARETAENVGGISGEMLLEGIENRDQKRGTIEELMFERILRVRPMLERFLPFLAITAAAAPLMGLLGTVMGMIKTFNLITEFGTGDAKSLSSGISEALVTTELGLIVAIPILILHGLLNRLSKRKLANLEQAALAYINGIIKRDHQKDAAA